MNPPSVELSIQALSKQFQQFRALQNINLDVYRGEFLCLLGPSGCGKTTLLRMIAGLESCSEGRILQAGRDITHASPAQRDFGIVFQSYALFPNLRIAENIAYGLKGSRAEKQQRVQELLDLIGLPDSGQKFPAQISGGQQQRVALARALANKPQLLLLDEPLSALDAQVREHLRSEIKALQQKLGVTTIMVTHDQDEALAMADRVVVMNHGVIEQIGTPEQIYASPNSRFVAQFIGHGNWLAAQANSAQSVMIGRNELQLSQMVETGRDYALFIRPEHIGLQQVESGNAWPSANATTGQVQQIELLGNIYRLQIALPQWNESSVEVMLSHREMAALEMRQGQTVNLYLPAANVRVFAAGQAA